MTTTDGLHVCCYWLGPGPLPLSCLNSHNRLLHALLESALAASGSLYTQQPQGYSCHMKSRSCSYPTSAFFHGDSWASIKVHILKDSPRGWPCGTQHILKDQLGMCVWSTGLRGDRRSPAENNGMKKCLGNKSHLDSGPGWLTHDSVS